MEITPVKLPSFDDPSEKEEPSVPTYSEFITHKFSRIFPQSNFQIMLQIPHAFPGIYTSMQLLNSNIMYRLCIYPKDVQVITGRSSRYSRYLMRTIKESLARKEKQFITVIEFCNYTGLPEKDVQLIINPGFKESAIISTLF